MISFLATQATLLTLNIRSLVAISRVRNLSKNKLKKSLLCNQM